MDMKMKFFAVVIMALFFLLAGAGCTRKVYVPVERFRETRDTLVRSNRISDTILLSDSIRIEVKGDTVRERSWHTRWRVRTVVDTVYKVREDSILSERIAGMNAGKAGGSRRGYGVWILAVVLLGGIIAGMKFGKNR